MTDISVEFKICEACGSIFTRPVTQQSAYCAACETLLKNFPTPETRKMRGRPTRKGKFANWKLAEAGA